jgi:FAD/FMN-containing dehydrogenase
MEQIIQALKTQQVPLLEPGHAEYRQAIASSNLIFRFCRPDVVVRPKSAAHVQAIINEAKADRFRLPSSAMAIRMRATRLL